MSQSLEDELNLIAWETPWTVLLDYSEEVKESDLALSVWSGLTHLCDEILECLCICQESVSDLLLIYRVLIWVVQRRRFSVIRVWFPQDGAHPRDFSNWSFSVSVDRVFVERDLFAAFSDSSELARRVSVVHTLFCTSFRNHSRRINSTLASKHQFKFSVR